MPFLLDAISRHEQGWVEYLSDFYFGNKKVEGAEGLKPQLEAKIVEIDPREMGRFLLGVPKEGPHREEVFVRVGKFGLSSANPMKRRENPAAEHPPVAGLNGATVNLTVADHLFPDLLDGVVAAPDDPC